MTETKTTPADSIPRRQDTSQFFRAVVSSRLGGRGPFHLSHLVTGRCDCRCPTCLWRDNDARELGTDEIENAYRGAGRAGFVANAIWGGEPLLREDLGRLLRASRQAGMVTTVITNGQLLPLRARELGREAHCFIVSVDYPEEDGHDAFRGVPGLFRKAVEGIETLRNIKPTRKIIINCLLHRGNERLMRGMADLARSLGVSLYVCPAAEGASRDTKEPNSAALAPRETQKEAALELLDLKSSGYPINNSRTYLRRYLLEERPYRCRVPLVFLTISPEGDVFNCFRSSRPYGNIGRGPLEEIMKNWGRGEAVELTKGCWRCNNPNVVDTSYVWELKREPLLNALKVFLAR